MHVLRPADPSSVVTVGPLRSKKKKQFLNFNQQIYLYATQRLVLLKLKQAYSDAQVICKYWRADWGYLCPVVLYRQYMLRHGLHYLLPPVFTASDSYTHTHTHHPLHCVADTLPFQRIAAFSQRAAHHVSGASQKHPNALLHLGYRNYASVMH